MEERTYQDEWIESCGELEAMDEEARAAGHDLAGPLPCQRCRYMHEGRGCEWGDDCPYIEDDRR